MQISGIVERVIFTNSENGYSVFVMDTEDGSLTCTGILFNLYPGDALELEGDFTYHDRYGEQFQFTSAERDKEYSSAGMKNYLMAGNVKNIGPVTAKNIIDHFGDETADIIENNPERLIEVRGIGPATLEKILDSLEESQGSRKVFVELAEYGITGFVAKKLYDKFLADAVDILKEDPYRVSRTVPGFGFVRADALANKMGIEKNDPRRVKAAIVYILQEAQLNGDMFLYEEEIKTLATRLVDDLGDINRIFTELVIGGDIVREPTEADTRVYLSDLNYMENTAARFTADLIMRDREENPIIDQVINKYLAETSQPYDETQKSAIKMALTNNISIITGGPGTGKTTIVRAIMDIAHKLKMDIKLSAPTGRAAKRLEETTGGQAKTIHRMLGLKPRSEDDYDLPTEELEADIILVDEMSMVDTELFAGLLTAMQDHTSLVLVGDSDQLPSVGPGNVLKDLIEVDAIPKTRLTNIYRRVDTSEISIASSDIKNGRMPEFNKEAGDVFFMGQTDEDEFLSTIYELLAERLPSYYGFDPINDIQILVPTKKGKLGTDNLNEFLQEHLNSDAQAKLKTKHGIFKVGDKVMQIKNNYERKIRYKSLVKGEEMGVFNGDIGIVTNIDKALRTVTVLFSDDYYAEYEEEDLGELRLAYAITVHKSQGSEFACVIFIAWKSNYLLNNRNLLYTGLTRAKELLLVMGSMDTFKQMIKNTNIQKRNTSLNIKIEEALDFARELSDM